MESQIPRAPADPTNDAIGYAQLWEKFERMQMRALWNHRYAQDDYGIQRKPIQYPYVEIFLDNDVSHIQNVGNHIHKSPNRSFVYEENIKYGERDMDVVNWELSSNKQFMQPLLFDPTTIPMEEQPPPPSLQVQLITITSKIGDSFEENCEVEDDIQEKIVGEIFVEANENEKLCLNAIYVDFFEYFSLMEPQVPCSKENSRMSFLQVGVLDV